MRRYSGFSLPEVLITITMTTIVLITVTTTVMQATRVYSKTSVHISPQEQEMLALRRMEGEMREAMFVNIITPTPSTWVELCLPKLDDLGRNLVVQDADGELGLVRDPAKDVCFFLGVKEANGSGWYGVPNSAGHTIFRALSSTATSAGKYPNAQVIIDGVMSTPMLPDPNNPGHYTAGRLFEYWPTDPNDPTRPTRDTQLIVITMTTLVTEPGGKVTYHTLRTQFCLRNWNSSQTLAAH